MFMVWKLQVVVVFLASEETKFKVDTTSIIWRYLHHFENVNKELITVDTVNLQHTKPCKQNATWENW